MTDPRPGGGGGGGEDAVASVLRTRLHDLTDRLEPRLTFDDVVHAVHASGHAHDGLADDGAGRRRTWARAGAISLAAASLIGVLAWSVRSPGAPTVSSPSTPASSPASTPGPATEPDPIAATSSPSTFPVAAPTAVNLLVVGTDDGACIDPESPYAGGFGDRSESSSRSDTIMMIRLDPRAEQAAILSFPRDLWVTISGRNSSNRINSTYVDDDPSRLIDTIFQNFGIWPDHFVQIDFCAFSTIVDAIGGVTVPFDRPVRDTNTGLYVPAAGCFTFDGDHALAYVRSRKLQVFDADGAWRTDPRSDLGRIARQQDLVVRVLDQVLDGGLADVGTIRSLLTAAQDSLVVDMGLTIDRMLEYAGALAAIEPGSIETYVIDVRGATISGNSVLVPLLDTPHSQDVLALFRGDRPLGEASDTTSGATSATTSATASDATDAIDDPLPVVPDPDIRC